MDELRSEPVWRTRYEKFVLDARPLSAAQRRRLSLIALALVGVGVVLFVCVLVDVLQPDRSAVYDSPIRLWLVGERSPALTAVMIGLAIIFGPVALPVIVLVLGVVWGLKGRHAWRPLVLAAAMLTGVVLAQILAPLVGRSRPPVELMLFGADHSFSFPSGHVLGAADFVLVLTFLIVSRRSSRRKVIVGFSIALVCIVLAAISRLYLGYHWTTDALASLAISFVVLGTVISWDTSHAYRSRQARTLRANALQTGAAGPNAAVDTVTD